MRSRKIPPQKKKVSKNDLLRRCNEEQAAKRKAEQNAIINYRALLLVASKLYAVEPEDEVFTNGTFQETALEAIKKQAELNKKEFETRLAATVAGKEKVEEKSA